MNNKYNIKLFKDGDMWCALIGENLESGMSGFGHVPVDAIRNLCIEIEMKSMDINYEICNY